MKYAEYLLLNLAKRHGYTHCFFVAGGNTMHLLDAARNIFNCIPVVHEVAAGIAAEYFNATNESGEKALALVTAGPGLTNIVTAIAGAYLESRDLLVIGGQVKTSDLRTGKIRQRGIQEIDGVALTKSITTSSTRLNTPIIFKTIENLLVNSERPGPVFLEIPLDVQGASVNYEIRSYEDAVNKVDQRNSNISEFVSELAHCLANSDRPVLLLGGGLSKSAVKSNLEFLNMSGIPVMTTWNGMDRYGSNFDNYWGRPNTWGQRSANILLQQADIIVALGTRLGMQQTGFAWQEFAPLAKIFQVEIDESELSKGHPNIYMGLKADADEVLNATAKKLENNNLDFSNWINLGTKVIKAFPLDDKLNITHQGFISPYLFVDKLSDLMNDRDVLIPCSSGAAFTVTMQAFKPKFGQRIVSNKGLASMGYGLSGAVGAAISTKRRTILIEGDGGFAQNIQELGTLVRQNLLVKIFLFSNRGYASIRMTQRNYFNGAYLGCDLETGLGLPNWRLISEAFGINYKMLDDTSNWERDLISTLESPNPEFVEIKIDPEQTYFPKISSRILDNGTMVSNPLHLMSPDLSDDQIRIFLPYLADRILGPAQIIES